MLKAQPTFQSKGDAVLSLLILASVYSYSQITCPVRAHSYVVNVSLRLLPSYTLIEDQQHAVLRTNEYSLHSNSIAHKVT